MFDLTVASSGPVGLVGGAQLDPEILNILRMHTDLFVAADGGADHLSDIGITPRCVIGDLDSISPLTRQKFADRLVQVADQDTTDLEKALGRISAPVILGAGFLGGRLDHTFSALSVLAKTAAQTVILLSDVDCCLRCPPGGLVMDLPVGTPLAVLPMDAVAATSRGLQWEMTQMPLHPAGFVASSNKTIARPVQITTTGPAIITVPRDQLPAVIAAVRAG